MTDVMHGVRVIEVALYLYAPSGGAVLADWGADVVKVERPGHADPMRRTAAWGLPASVRGISYLWEVANRGKRAVAIDIGDPDGRELLLTLVEGADVFLTNFLPEARRRLGIDIEDVMARNHRIVYARASAVGPKGPDAGSGGFDGITYWARSGAAASITPPESPSPLPMPGPGFGDIQSGMALAGGIAAALYQREKTGTGLVVDASLLASGLWAMQPSVAATTLHGTPALPEQRRDTVANPIVNQYRTQDGRYIALAMLESDRYWPDFCVAVDRVDWIADPRFVDAARREANAAACTRLLDELFATRPLAEWTEILAQQEGQWDVVRVPGEAPADSQAIANAYVQRIDHGDGRSLHLVPAPVQFDEKAPSLGRAPEHAEHTDEVLLGAGVPADRIAQLREAGVIA